MSDLTGADDSPRRSSVRTGWIVAAVVGAVAVVLLGLRAVGALGSASADRDISIDGEHVAITMTVPNGLAIDEVSANPGNSADPDCPTVRYALGNDLVVEAVSTGCTVEPDPEVMNGDHGTYRTLADVADPINAREVTTTAGQAHVFVQHYEEHTNMSRDWEEPVAIVTLDDPVDADFPTLTLRSDKAALSRDELTEVVMSLAPLE